MSIYSNLLSHPHQTLEKHVQGVRDIALSIHHSRSGSQEIDFLVSNICITHDFGKGTTFFQKYLQGEYSGCLKDHGLISAMFTYYILPEEYKLIGFLVVKRHHGDIANAAHEVRFKDRESIVHQQLLDICENTKDALIHIYGEIVVDFIEYAVTGKLYKDIEKSFRKLKNKTLEDLILASYLYSLLLTADKSQLIRKTAYIQESSFIPAVVENYKNSIVNQLEPKKKSSEIFQIRQELFDMLKNSLNKLDVNKQRLLSVHVPTGGGKTFLSYYAAFDIACRKQSTDGKITSQVIYCLPFMSVIDQNYQVLEKILKYNQVEQSDEDLLKYHSLSEIKYSDFTGFDARFLFDNWQSKVVTTTFVQLFNTLFKVGDNSITHRFYTLSNAVVILDEVQAIDPKFYPIIRHAVDILQREYHTTFILVTATMPMLLDTVSLIPDNMKYFQKLSRIKLISQINTPLTVEQFISQTAEEIDQERDKSFLIVLNTVKSAKRIYQSLKEYCNREIMLLTTEIYPKLRLQKIDEIRNSKNKYVVISTQLIEAGVDIDMDIVYRDLAPFDCIQQTAGRANRNGIGGEGIVKVIKLIDDNGKYMSSYIYPLYLLDITQKILNTKEVYEERDFISLSQQYYLEVKKKASTYKSEELKAFIKKLEFESFRKSFNLIENDYIKEDIYIDGDEVCNQLLKELKEEKDFERLELSNLFRKLNQYRIGISKKEVSEGKIPVKYIEKYQLQYVDKEDYDENLGIIRTSQIIL